MSSFSTDRIPFVTLDRSSVRVRPFRSIERLPRPKARSGLVPAASERPEPPKGDALRLRRAVAWIVVIGSVCLVGYAASQRVHGATTSMPHGAHARP